MKKLRIAQVAPLFESVPPRLYGGTERVVAYLTEELVAAGHDVTLFASGDSHTSARLVPACGQALRLKKDSIDELAPHVLMLQLVQDRTHHFDIVHYHIDYLHYPLSRNSVTPQVTTLHGRLDIPELKALYEIYDDMPVVSISESQRQSIPEANWLGTVYHGLPERQYKPRSSGGGYLAFLGRISPEKGPDKAIEIASRCGMELKIAAKIEKKDWEYYEKNVSPLLDNPLVEFIGEVGEQDKCTFLSGAEALLFPIDWPEPFGLTMIEALACGTPVIAFNKGSVPEIIDHGKTGFVVENIDEAVHAVKNIGLINRNECRAAFDERFTAQRMASGYLKLYYQVLERNHRKMDLEVMDL